MQKIRADTDNNLRKGTIRKSATQMISYRHRPSTDREDISRHTTGGLIQDISNLGFWDVDARFITNTDVEKEKETLYGSGIQVVLGNTTSIAALASTEASPNVWIAADSLVKSLYSTVMTDLGQTDTQSNILLNATALQHFTRNFSAMQSQVLNAIPGPANESYEMLENQTGPLNTSTSIITNKYLCQIPQRKSTGTLILSILVADLVFLQASWKLFYLCTSSWITHRNPAGTLSPR